jgi:hypothetical protein
MQVMVNYRPVITIKMVNFLASNCVTRSRSTIVCLSVGDQIYVTAQQGQKYFVDHQVLQIFSGMRLF